MTSQHKNQAPGNLFSLAKRLPQSPLISSPLKMNHTHKMNCTLGILLLLSALLFGAVPAQAKYASFVIDAATGDVLHAVNADTRNYPASLTKMMTLYLVFEALDEGRMRLDDRILMSRRAARQPPSKLGIKAGQSLSVATAIRALTIKSANDIAVAVAEHMAGTERQFALLMTAKARSLGMSNTTFRNASGLPHHSQLSTARDMAKLARAILLHFPNKYRYFSETSFSYNGKKYKNHNKLLINYEGTDGIKTGYIRASGFNLVASVKRGNRRLIGVVFGAKNGKSRNRHMVNLLEKGWLKIAPRYALARTQAKFGSKQKRRKISDVIKTASLRKPSLRKPSLRSRSSQKARSIWGVQVGAYKTRAPAYEIAVQAMGLAPSYLGDGDIAVTPLEKKSGRVLFRGRVMGISKNQAYRACRYLKKRKLGCMPLRIAAPLEVAFVN